MQRLYSHAGSPATQSSRHLAGIDDILRDSIAYLRRSSGIAQPRPLLLVGAKGAGKTSLVKLLAERLESDRDVLPGEWPELSTTTSQHTDRFS